MSVCWIDGIIVNKNQAKISVFDHGLLYGDGVFEGIRFYNKQVFQLKAHLARLLDSAKSILLNIPYTTNELEAAINDVINAYAADNGYLRLVITRGKGPLSINPENCPRCTTLIIADQLSVMPPSVLQKGAKLVIASTRRLPVDGLDPRVKSLNYLNHILAKIEANQANADEAVLLNAHGYVTEGTTDNIFITKNNQLLTPPISDGALNGITRNVVLELARKLGIPCHEATLSPHDLYIADECFLTGTAVELIPVRQIDGRNMRDCPGPIYQKLQNAFNEEKTRLTL